MADMAMNSTWPSEAKLEAYSVVLSVTTLLLSAIGGGGGSLTVICAILTSKSIHKLSYSLILLLLLASLALDILWTPPEIVHLLYFHHTSENPTDMYKMVVHGIYLLLVTVVALAVVLVSVENIVRQCGHMGRMFQKLWAVLGCVGAVFLALCLACVYIVISINQEVDVLEYFVVINSQSFHMKVVILGSFTFLVLAVMLCVIASAIIHRKHAGFHDNEGGGLKVPQLLIRDSQPSEGDSDSEDTPSVHAASPLPLLAINAAGGSRDGPLPISPKNKNMLGVNMSQILGRRRHTICQIGDSSNNFMNPAEKAKKYNYVRKFSVDISALQAQLENPKLFSGKAPFQSDTDIHANNRTNSQKGRLPLKPLELPEHEEKPEPGESNIQGNSTLPVLPVITVSDDEGADQGDPSEQGSAMDNTSERVTFKLPVSEESHESDHDSLHSFEEATSDPSLSFTKLSCLLAATFCLCTLPLFLTEVLRKHLSTISYINITTCTLALSTIQTIIYPQVIICMDSVVHRAVHKLWRKLLRLCWCAGTGGEGELDETRTTTVTTDTSQV